MTVAARLSCGLPWFLTAEVGVLAQAGMLAWPLRRSGAGSGAVMGVRTRSEPAPALVDRQRERAALDGLLGDLRSGRGRALVVRGEAGVGKSALLEYAAGAAPDLRLVRAVGVESEMELAFAAFISCARPCSLTWSGFRPRSATRWGSRSGCGRGPRRTGSWSGWRY